MLRFQGYWYAIAAPGVSLMMYLVCGFTMNIPQSMSLQKPWGDSTILYSLAPGRAICVGIGMIITRILLILIAATRVFWRRAVEQPHWLTHSSRNIPVGVVPLLMFSAALSIVVSPLLHAPLQTDTLYLTCARPTAGYKIQLAGE